MGEDFETEREASSARDEGGTSASNTTTQATARAAQVAHTSAGKTQVLVTMVGSSAQAAPAVGDRAGS